jgi:hypothetical protein
MPAAVTPEEALLVGDGPVVDGPVVVLDGAVVADEPLVLEPQAATTATMDNDTADSSNRRRVAGRGIGVLSWLQERDL